MNKAIAIFLLLTSLNALTNSEIIKVSVGTPDGENKFDPQTVMAAMGDTVCTTIFFLFYIICNLLFTKITFLSQ